MCCFYPCITGTATFQVFCPSIFLPPPAKKTPFDFGRLGSVSFWRCLALQMTRLVQLTQGLKQIPIVTCWAIDGRSCQWHTHNVQHAPPIMNVQIRATKVGNQGRHLTRSPYDGVDPKWDSRWPLEQWFLWHKIFKYVQVTFLNATCIDILLEILGWQFLKWQLMTHRLQKPSGFQAAGTWMTRMPWSSLVDTVEVLT